MFYCLACQLFIKSFSPHFSGPDRGECDCGQCKCKEAYIGDNCGAVNCDLARKKCLGSDGVSV